MSRKLITILSFDISQWWKRVGEQKKEGNKLIPPVSTSDCSYLEIKNKINCWEWCIIDFSPCYWQYTGKKTDRQYISDIQEEGMCAIPVVFSSKRLGEKL